MTRRPVGRSRGAALILGLAVTAIPLWSASGTAQPVLVAETRDGVTLGRLPFGPDQEICLTWSHSVTGGAVADCFENWSGTMVLTRSFLHDFAAGLGEVTGRGTLLPAKAGGYWIIGIDEPIPSNTLLLRAGTAQVNHKLIAVTKTDQSHVGVPSSDSDASRTGQNRSLPLSLMAAGQSLRLRLQDN